MAQVGESVLVLTADVLVSVAGVCIAASLAVANDAVYIVTVLFTALLYTYQGAPQSPLAPGAGDGLQAAASRPHLRGRQQDLPERRAAGHPAALRRPKGAVLKVVDVSLILTNAFSYLGPHWPVRGPDFLLQPVQGPGLLLRGAQQAGGEAGAKAPTQDFCQLREDKVFRGRGNTCTKCMIGNNSTAFVSFCLLLK